MRWDSLGEYLAIAVSLEHLGESTNNPRALKLGKALNSAIERLLENRKSPSRKVNELDNRASNFYIGGFLASHFPPHSMCLWMQHTFRYLPTPYLRVRSILPPSIHMPFFTSSSILLSTKWLGRNAYKNCIYLSSQP